MSDTLASHHSHHPRISWIGISLVFVAPALGGFIYGYDIGATSFALAILSTVAQDDDVSSAFETESPKSTVWWHDFGQGNGLQEGLFVSGISLGALLGSHLVLFHLAAAIGRRMELRISAILYLVGSLTNIASGTILATTSLGWPALLIGRIVFGMGVGITMHGAPNYMAEMSPSSIRGAVVSAKETLIVLGILVGYAVGDQLSDKQCWTVLYQVSFMLSVPMLFLTFVIPRSVRWLLLQPQSTDEDAPNLLAEAKQSLQFVHQDDATEELDRIAHQVLSNRLQKHPSTPAAAGEGCCGTLNSLFRDSSVTPALVVALGLLCFQEGSGQPAVLSYATVIFEEAGWGGHASVITASIMLCVSTSTVFLVDVVGRKRMLQVCATVMGIALAVLSWEAPSIGNPASSDWQRVLVLASMMVYIGGYQIGFGPVIWLVVAEVFPNHVRGQASALAVEMKYVSNFVVQFGVPVLQRYLGWRFTFGLFGLLMVIAATYFIPTFVQETKGLSLEQIEAKSQQQFHSNDDDSSRTSVISDHSSTEHSHLLVEPSSTNYSNLV